MTNADKYLKEGVDIGNFICELRDYLDSHKDGYDTSNLINNFLNKQTKPTLTEDEKVILRHINTINIDRIGRHDCGDLILLSKSGGFYLMTTYFNFDGLFQFIQPRRRI